MFKAVVLLKRKPGMTFEDFVTYYESTHAKIGERVLPTAERYFRRLLEVSPQESEIQNNLAWLLVTRPDAEAAQLEEGLQLARWAARSNDSAFIWDTVAEALHRGGRPTEAQSAAARAFRLAVAGKGRGSASLTYYRNRRAALGRGEGKKGKNNP